MFQRKNLIIFLIISLFEKKNIYIYISGRYTQRVCHEVSIPDNAKDEIAAENVEEDKNQLPKNRTQENIWRQHIC